MWSRYDHKDLQIIMLTTIPNLCNKTNHHQGYANKELAVIQVFLAILAALNKKGSAWQRAQHSAGGGSAGSSCRR
jgi:hypothetical protein